MAQGRPYKGNTTASLLDNIMAGMIFFDQSFITHFICQLSCVKLHKQFYRVIRQRPKPHDWLKKNYARHARQNGEPQRSGFTGHGQRLYGGVYYTPVTSRADT
jgi:hypothetical protein